jgi:alpha-tubulin suppressor-like RCC1 family protein
MQHSIKGRTIKMKDVRKTGGHFKRFGVGIILSVLLLLMVSTGWATPTVIDIQPPDGSMQPVSTTASATFSEAMDPATITTGSLTVSRVVGVKAIAAGQYHTVVVKGDGTVAAWGKNQYGGGGDNYGMGSVPTGLSGVTAVAAGDTHTVVLKDDGTVVAWGNTYPAADPRGLSRVIAIAAGTYHSVALQDDGTVVAWGGDENNYGNQAMVPATLTGVKAIAACGLKSVALKTDGTVVTWASSSLTWVPTGLSGVTAIAAGRTHIVALKGNGTVVTLGGYTVPAGLSGVIAIAAGDQYSLALKNDGTVVAWGNNTYNQISGAANLSGIVAIAGGGNHAVALKNDGTIVTWGSNAYGQTSIPAVPSGIIAIAAGGDWAGGFSVVLKADNTMVAWGSNSYGETAVPANLSGVIAIGAGRFHTVALKGDGTVVTLGNGPSMADLSGVKAISAGMFSTVALMNDGTVVARGDYSYTMPAGLSGVKAISAGGANHTLALKNDGTVVAWGWNGSGQTNVPAGLSGVVAIAAGGNHSVALKGDGTVVAWGYNYSGQTNVPAGLSGVVAIAAGYWGTTALKNDGTVVAWGGNSNGVPAGLSGVVAIAAGNHTVALKGDGTFVAWGDNIYGQCTVPTSPYESPVDGAVTYDQIDNIATFTPLASLNPVASYVVTVNTGARNTWGERIVADVRSSFTTDKAPATITLDDLNQTYDGTAKAVTATTDPAGLNVVITYDGSSTAPTNADSYAVVATINDPRYYGDACDTLVIDKATAQIDFVGLNQIYDGRAKIVTATTTPAGLTVDLTYDTGATNADSYDVSGIINDINYQGSNTGILEVAKATANVTLGSLNQTYNSYPREVTATTVPAGLTVDFTYNGSATAPINAGSYPSVVGTVNDVNYQGSKTGTLEVAKATANVTLGSLNQTYTGNPREVTATTIPAGLTVDFTYNGSATAPINAGSYPFVVGTVNDVNYQGSDTGTLEVAKATASINFVGLNQIYDTKAKIVTATTTPAGLTVDLAYDTSATNVGSYSVLGTVVDANYKGSANDNLDIVKANQEITNFTPPATARKKELVPLTATASLPVTFTVTSGPGVIVGSNLTFTSTGTVIVTATQSGDNNYNAAANVKKIIIVSAN